MASIILENVTLKYPVFGANSFSLKNSVLHLATGGKLVKDWKVLEVQAIDSLSFTLNNGDRLALIGHNGAGKTSLLKMLAKVYTPTQGKIRIEGILHSLFDLMMGMDLDGSGYDNIKLRGLIAGLSKKEIATIIDDVEQFADLGEFIKMPIRTYSSGMLIRFGFGVITAIKSDILLIDEVIGVGDQQFMQKALQRMDQRIEASEILVLSSHDLVTARKFCNKGLWLEHGRMKMLGSIDDVISSYTEYYEVQRQDSLVLS